MTDIVNILADEATSILEHTCSGIPGSVLHAPGPDYIDRIVAHKNRKPAVLRNLNALYNHGQPGWDWLYVFIAGRPGCRTFCRCILRTQSIIF